jgi:hypothetical protein
MWPAGIPAQLDTAAALISKPDITTTAAVLTVFIVHSFFSDLVLLS